MAFFRCGTGGGPSGYEIFITTEDSRLYGLTITIKKGTTTVGTTTFDNSGEATYNVEETGTYTVSVTFEGVVYSETVEVQAFEVELSAGFQYTKWLSYTDLDPTDYPTLASVLADEEAVRQLMTIHAAVDYLADQQSTDTSVVTILNDNYAAKWISLTDYAMDTLEAAYGTLMGTIGKYGYGEWGITDATTTPPTWGALGNVPVMTSNTAPYGTASASSISESATPAYAAFNGITPSGWRPTSGATNNYIQYEFTNPVCAKKVSAIFYITNSCPARTFTIKASNDGFVSDTHDVGTLTLTARSTSGDTETISADLTTDAYYKYYRVFCADTLYASGSWSCTMAILQFYGRTLRVSVPKMSGNTTPYGEASVSVVTGTIDPHYNSNQPWQVFNGDNEYEAFGNSGGNPVINIDYEFSNAVVIRKFMLVNTVQAYGNPKQIVIQGSNDNQTFTTLATLSNLPWNVANKVTIADVNNNTAYKKYRMVCSASGYMNSDFPNARYVYIKNVQLWGKDYSEREWDTSHPRRYLYDHGVELETIATSGHDSAYGNGYTTRYPHFKADGAEIGENVAKVFYPFVTDAKVDVTNYDTLAVVYEPFNSYGSTTDSLCGRVGATASKNPSDGYYLGTSYNTLVRAKTDPYTIADFSSLNGEYYIGVVTDENGRMDTIKELWLE